MKPKLIILNGPLGIHKLIRNLFKDKTGRVVIWQPPNIPIYGWLAFKVLAMLTTQTDLERGFELTSSAFLFLWAYLELTRGVNYFRRTLGLLVISLVTLGFFMR